MDIATLLHKLTTEGFTLGGGCIPNSLEIAGPPGRMTPQLSQAITEHKATLLALVGPQTDPYIREEREAIANADRPGEAVTTALADVGQWFTCRTHLDRSDWDDALDIRPGWIRTTCRKCGRFIGSRPEEMQKSSQGKTQSRKMQAAEDAANIPGDSNHNLWQ